MTLRVDTRLSGNTVNANGYIRFAKSYGYFLAALSIKLIYVGAALYKRRDKWVTRDWEINYAGGFVRRGLLGEGARLAGGLLRLPAAALVLALQWACYSAMFWSVSRMLKGLSWSLWIVLLVYSPATLSFTLFSINRAMHKEILFLAVLALFLAAAPPSSRLAVISFSLALGGVVLTHEAMAMYLPYAFCAIYLHSGDLQTALLAMVPPLIAFYAAATHPGTTAQAAAICRSLGGSSLDDETCSGAIRYLTYTPQQAHADASESWRHFRLSLQVPYVIALATLPVGLALRCLWPTQRRDSISLMASSGLSWITSVSLFWFSTDWDRWVYIHTFSSMLLLLPIERRRQELIS